MDDPDLLEFVKIENMVKKEIEDQPSGNIEAMFDQAWGSPPADGGNPEV